MASGTLVEGTEAVLGASCACHPQLHQTRLEDGEESEYWASGGHWANKKLYSHMQDCQQSQHHHHQHPQHPQQLHHRNHHRMPLLHSHCPTWNITPQCRCHRHHLRCGCCGHWCWCCGWRVACDGRAEWGVVRIAESSRRWTGRGCVVGRALLAGRNTRRQL